MIQPRALAKLDMILGECPRWQEIERAWYWVDITCQRFYRYLTDTNKLETRTLTFQPACFSFTTHNQLILTSSEGVYALEHFHAPLRWLGDPEPEFPENRFNDGVTTQDGHFIAGTIGDINQPVGNSYALSVEDNRLTFKQLDAGFHIINGQAISPDGQYYYVTDTPSQVIYRYQYDAQSKTLTDKTLFYRCERDEYPDGAAIDQDGNYWVAMYGSGKISVIQPNGEKLKDIELPVSQPTMVAFGGPDLTDMIVTTASQTLSPEQKRQQPLAGSVLIFRTEHVGTLNAKMPVNVAAMNIESAEQE